MTEDHTRSKRKFLADMQKLSGLGHSKLGLGDQSVQDERPVKQTYRGGVQPRRKAG